MVYEVAVNQFAKVLTNLEECMVKAAAYADSKKFEMDVLLNARLAPDQFNFIKQVQIACDTAKLGCSRLTGQEAPTHEDTEKTIAELRTRIQSTNQYLKSLTAKHFENWATKRITTPRWEGKTLSGEELLIQHVLPNFYFHITTAYAILRHNGVALGKKDYLGNLPFKS